MKTKITWYFVMGLLLLTQLSFAQQKTVTGTVTDEEGLPLPGVNIVVQGTTRGTQTGFEGQYSIEASQGEILEFSYIGFAPEEILVENDDTIDLLMRTDSESLDEVVVVGYGTTTKQSFTGTATVVDGEQLSQKNVSNVSQALAGEAAGVRVINTSGQPGSSATVRIRGFGSVNGNRDPLYVVDGVPFSSQDIDGNATLSSINPEDIESTTILKDAAATAIYGSRGANGVVVINTKKGKAGTSSIEVSTRTGVNFSGLPRYNTIESPEGYIGLGWEGLYNAGVAQGEDDAVDFANQNLFSGNGVDPKYNLWNVDNVSQLINPETRMVGEGVGRIYNPEDWEDYGFQASNRTQADLKISGGSEKTTYYTSFGYLNDVGYIIDSDYERFAGRLNLTHQAKDWLKGSVNMGYTYSTTNNNGQAEDSGSIFWFVDNIPPIYPLFLRDENGNRIPEPIYGGFQYDYGEGRGFGGLTNSIADAIYSGSSEKKHEINISSRIDATITDWLSFETTFGTQYYNNSGNSLQNPFYGPSAGQGGSIFKTKTELFTYNFLQLLRFDKSFGKHSIDALVAHESNSWERQYLYVNKANLINPQGTELNNAVVGSSLPGSYTEGYTLESFFSQVNYNFDDTYFLSGSIRRDGSSRFVQDKWDTFGSISGAWVLSNEDFMDNQSIFDYLKLKSSYGLIGEQAGVGYYPGYNQFDIGNLNDQPSFAFNTLGNPDLTWETSEMFQAGLEFRIGTAFNASFDYYRKLTKNLLFERRRAISTGVAIINVNDGELINQGLEFDLTGHLLQTNDAYIDLNVNGSIIGNELQRMPIEPSTGQPKVLDQQGLFGRSEGHSIFDFYLRDYQGVNPENGLSQWKVFYIDNNGDGAYQASEGILNLTDYLANNPDVDQDQIQEGVTETYSQATQHYTGQSAIPDVRGAINLSGGYKGFTMRIQLLYQLGGYGYDRIYAGLMDDEVVGSGNWHADMYNRWQEPGDITNVPQLSNGNNLNVNSASTRFVTKADYLALNNIQLGYNVPRRWVENLGMNQLSFTLTGDNLFLLSERDGFNPSTAEAGDASIYTYSPLSTITAGVRVNF